MNFTKYIYEETNNPVNKVGLRTIRTYKGIELGGEPRPKDEGLSQSALAVLKRSAKGVVRYIRPLVPTTAELRGIFSDPLKPHKKPPARR